MSDQFQHVMVLTSIIIGLGITHLLTGVASALDRANDTDRQMRIGFAHTTWVSTIFTWMVIFWWFQFRLLALVELWTLSRYFFIILYAVLLYLLSAVLIPQDWKKVTNLDAYFISQRHWFFTIYLLANFADVVDTLMKGGWGQLVRVGLVTNVLILATIPIVFVGFRSTNIRTHSVIAVIVLIAQTIGIFQSAPDLG